MKTIYLVSCVKQKAESPRPAEDLYTSDWFRKARAFVKGHLGPLDHWYVLSAKYHLVEPRRTIPPYNETLKQMRKTDRVRWGACVLSQLLAVADAGDSVVLLAGERYRESIEPVLRAHGCSVQVPMAGLGIGKQKAWLLRHMQDEEPTL